MILAEIVKILGREDSVLVGETKSIIIEIFVTVVQKGLKKRLKGFIVFISITGIVEQNHDNHSGDITIVRDEPFFIEKGQDGELYPKEKKLKVVSELFG